MVEERLRAPGREVVNLGLIDSPERGLAAGHEARRQDIDLLVLYVTTYALSSTVLPLVRRAKVPVLVLNLQPEAAIDYKRFQRPARPHANDRRVAGILLRVPRARTGQCLRPGWNSISPSHRGTP